MCRRPPRLPQPQLCWTGACGSRPQCDMRLGKPHVGVSVRGRLCDACVQGNVFIPAAGQHIALSCILFRALRRRRVCAGMTTMRAVSSSVSLRLMWCTCSEALCLETSRF